MSGLHFRRITLSVLVLGACGDDGGAAAVDASTDRDVPDVGMLDGALPDGALQDGTLADVGGSDAGAQQLDNDVFRISLSPSPWATVMFANDIEFEVGGEVAVNPSDLIRLFAKHGGANEVYARASTRNEYGGAGADRSFSTLMARAQQAKSAGLPLNIELGLFRTYGEISCQTPPDFSDYDAVQDFFPEGKSAWHELTLAEMEDLLARYGLLVASAVQTTGVAVNVWDLGNEVDLGTAGVSLAPFPTNPCDGEEGGAGWYHAPDLIDPDIGAMEITDFVFMSEAERIAWLEENLWPYQAKLLEAVARGIRQVYPNAKFSTHLAGTFLSPTWVTAFFDAMSENGFEVDEFGFSYYPTAPEDPDAKLAQVKSLVTMLKADHPDKKVFLAEFGYPSGMPMGAYAAWDNPPTGYALSEADQARFTQNLASWARASGLDGIRPFAPELIVLWEPFSFFKRGGEANRWVAKSSLDAIWRGALAPNADAL